jgi:xanthine dehydrogenase molybdopterin-binding subunit B
MAQFASDTAAEGLRLPLQKVNFTAEPTLQNTAPAPAEASPAPRRAQVFATAAAATRTWRRLAVAGRSWLVRRVEVAFRQDDVRSHAEPGLIRLSQAS